MDWPFWSMGFGGINTQAQESVEPGGGGGGSGGSSICCQAAGLFCQDRFGNAYSDSVESPGPTCTRP